MAVGPIVSPFAAVISLDGQCPPCQPVANSGELITGEGVSWLEGKTTLTLAGERLAVCDLYAGS
jgi:hypothetical protein